mmetsp:Transcript_17456/g.15386  ORF Transcript_17456/g.15386 Transcript_17456/m.15386 type:complete len:99 (+) Transcript_17456:909-1205(+)
METVRIESNNIVFAVADGSSNILIKARKFNLEFIPEDYNIQGEYIIINLKSPNILIEGITRETNTVLYNKTRDLKYDVSDILIHQSQIQDVLLFKIST